MGKILTLVLAAASLAFATAPASAQNWWTLPSIKVGGFSADVGIVRGLNSHIVIDDGTTTTANMSGYALAGTASYLVQVGHAAFGPRAQIWGGMIEAMPTGYIARTNGGASVGLEGGLVFGPVYGYGFGQVGAAWLSEENLGRMMKHDGFASLVQVGGGVRIHLKDGWYAKGEGIYNLIGDDIGAGAYFDRKASMSVMVGFGRNFNW